jgi:hypothetical protein
MWIKQMGFWVGVIFGWFLSMLVLMLWHENEPTPTCERVALKQKALQMCLKYPTTCISVTIDDFVVYYDNRDWLESNCPANNDDGFQSY